MNSTVRTQKACKRITLCEHSAICAVCVRTMLFYVYSAKYVCIASFMWVQCYLCVYSTIYVCSMYVHQYRCTHCTYSIGKNGSNGKNNFSEINCKDKKGLLRRQK